MSRASHLGRPGWRSTCGLSRGPSIAAPFDSAHAFCKFAPKHAPSGLPLSPQLRKNHHAAIHHPRLPRPLFLKKATVAAAMLSPSFPPTRWSLILHRDQSPAAARKAAEEICRLYWRPVYGYILHGIRWRRPEEAEDLTQGFFLDLLQRGLFCNVDPSMGRLRNYLLGAVKHYLQSAERHNAAQKRGGGIRFLPLDLEAEHALQIARAETSGLTPDEQFDRRWAECLLETCLAQIKEEYAGRGRVAEYETLRPLLANDSSQLRGEAAAALGLSAATLRVTLHRFRHRYREILADEVRSTLLPGMEVEEELRHLAALLRKRAS